MDRIIKKLCSIQGRLFELASIRGYDSEKFISTYMKSDIARHYNSKYDSLQWMGEEYILDLLEEKYQLISGHSYSKDVMFWIGYLYCYWHYKTFDSCISIIETAPPKTMFQNYYAMHTIDADLAIENLLQLSIREKQNKQGKEVFKYITKNNIENLYINKDEKEYRKIIVDIIAENIDMELRKKEKQNNDYKLSNEIGHIRLSYIRFIINLIDESNWNIRKKVEYKTIIDSLVNKVIHYGFTQEIYTFFENIYNELYYLKSN